MSSAYDISGVLPNGMIKELPAGTSVLINGPTMIGKRELALRLLATGHETGDGILCVTTSDDAASLLDEFERQIPSLERDRVGVVDCSGGDHRRTIQEIATERVASPGDLTGISIGTAKLLQRFSKQDIEDVRHGLVSVSTLIQYLDLNTVFKFLHIYTSRIDDTDGLGVFTVDAGTHDRQTIDTITGEFDCVIELREDDAGDREIRIKGLSGVDRSWHPY
ncbi:RAD55 family ATPase [Natronoarchaeum mannanilyticum]